jgi:DNA-binding NtrC family response regulator
VIPARLLLVEDDPDLRSMLTELLTANGYTVEAAADGQRGLHLGLTRTFDVLLLSAANSAGPSSPPSAAAATNWDDREPTGTTVNHRGRP